MAKEDLLITSIVDVWCIKTMYCLLHCTPNTFHLFLEVKCRSLKYSRRAYSCNTCLLTFDMVDMNGTKV